MFRNFVVLSVSLFLASTAAFAQDDFHVFPQVADGRFPDNSFYTSTLTITPWLFDVTCAITLRGLAVDFGGGTDSSFTTTLIPEEGFLSVRTTGAPPLGTGYMTVTCDELVFAEVTYSSFTAGSQKTAEATVFSSAPTSQSRIAVDLRDSARVAVAIANDTDIVRTYDLELRTSSGTVVSAGTVDVSARTGLPRFIDEIMPVPTGHEALLLEVIADDFSDFSAIGLRFTGAVFTTVPAN